MKPKATHRVLNIADGDKLIFPGATIDVTRLKNKRCRIVVTASREVAYVYVPKKYKPNNVDEPRS